MSLCSKGGEARAGGERRLSGLAQRMRAIEPFHVMALLARARELEAHGRSIIHMEIGEPDFPTPGPICEAGIRAMQHGELFYTPALGLSSLREAVAEYYRTRYGVVVPPSRIVITTGSSAALLLALAVVVDAGAEVLVSDPGYPANRHLVRLLEGAPVNVPVGADSNYQLTPELVEQYWTSRTCAALVATPSNPTGTVVPREHLERIRRFVQGRGGALIVDEIYHGLLYEGETRTALELSDEVFVINSFSKYFNMTGWRLGWMIAPAPYVDAIEKLAQNVYLSPPTTAQLAALAAFSPETLAILDSRRDEFRRRRDFLVPALRRIGFDVPQSPQGAFYIYAGCSRLTRDSFAFSRELLEEAGVAVTPGADFGSHRAAEHVRFAYTNSIDRLEEGVRRIAAFLNDRADGSMR